MEDYRAICFQICQYLVFFLVENCARNDALSGFKFGNQSRNICPFENDQDITVGYSDGCEGHDDHLPIWIINTEPGKPGSFGWNDDRESDLDDIRDLRF